MTTPPRRTRPFVAVDSAGNYAPQLARIRGRQCSGVYGIIDRQTGRVLYVGESHTGRLYDTITRHFRQWVKRSGYADGRRTGGETYDRSRVLVTYFICRSDEAQDEQYAEIQRLNPRDNQVDGSTITADQPAPF